MSHEGTSTARPSPFLHVRTSYPHDFLAPSSWWSTVSVISVEDPLVKLFFLLHAAKVRSSIIRRRIGKSRRGQNWCKARIGKNGSNRELCR